MKYIAIALFALVAGAYAIESDVTAQVLRSESVVEPESYNYAYETSNGIAGKAAGQLKTINKDESGIVSNGEFGWTSPEGEKIALSYVADENGYQPTGSHLPVAPAIPEQIARALRYLQEHPQPIQH